MTHAIGTREQWLKARLELLQVEKDHVRQADELDEYGATSRTSVA